MIFIDDEVGYILCPQVSDLCGPQEHNILSNTYKKISSKQFNQDNVWVYNLTTLTADFSGYSIKLDKIDQAYMKIFIQNRENEYVYKNLIYNEHSVENINIEQGINNNVYLVVVPIGSSPYVQFTAGSIPPSNYQKIIFIVFLIIISIVILIAIFYAIRFRKKR